MNGPTHDFYDSQFQPKPSRYVLPHDMSFEKEPNGLAKRGEYYKNLNRNLPGDLWEDVLLTNISATVAEWWYDPSDHTQRYPYSGSWLWFHNLIPMSAANNGLGNPAGMALSELKMTFALLDSAGAVINDSYIKMRFSNSSVAAGPPYSQVRTPPADGIKTRQFDTFSTEPLPVNSFNGIRLTCSTSTNLISLPGGSVAILRPSKIMSEIAGDPP